MEKNIYEENQRLRNQVESLMEENTNSNIYMLSTNYYNKRMCPTTGCNGSGNTNGGSSHYRFEKS